MATVNYSFNLPTVGGDDDVWGDLLNANWTALDTRLFSGSIGASTTGNAATSTLAATATLAVDATTLATPRSFTIGATARNFDGSANVSWSLADIGVVLANQAEAEAGTDNTKYMTPLRAAQAIAALTPAVAQLTQVQVENSDSEVFGTVSGQRLKQAVDEFAPAPPSQAPVQLAEAVISTNVSNVTITGLPAYAVYHVLGDDFARDSSSTGDLILEVSANNGGSWLELADFRISYGIGGGTTRNFMAELTVPPAGIATPRVLTRGWAQTTYVSGMTGVLGPINAVRIRRASNNFSAGTLRVYGMHPGGFP